MSGLTWLNPNPNIRPDRHPTSTVTLIQTRARFVMMNCGALRVQGELATSRALGDVHLKPYVGAKPDIRPRHIGENDDFLIIASDGLWDVVKPQ
eukprot:1052010-Amorphochlora_amoeboformis.AAC.1